MKVKVQLMLEEDDVKWLEKIYGDMWPQRMEQHIANEIYIRREYNENPLKMREKWDY